MATSLSSPIFCKIFAFLQQRYPLICLIAVLLCTGTSAAPSPLIYIGNEMQADAGPDAIYRLVYYNSQPRIDLHSKRDKKYDRNCFFSPVQCMLSYNANSNDVIYHPSGKR